MSTRPENRRKHDRSQAPDEQLTPEDISRILKVPVETLYQWRRKRIGPPAARVGRHLRYDPSKFARWLEELTEGGD